MTRFECPRCQHVFVAETADEQAFADCPECASLALPTGEATHAGGGDVELTDEHASITSADEFRPPQAAQRPGIFTDLVGPEAVAPSFAQSATAVHDGPSPSKMPSSLFAAPPSLEGAPVDDGGLSPFAFAEEQPEEEDLYRAATEAFVPSDIASSPIGGGSTAAGFGVEAAPWAGLPTPSGDGPSVDAAPASAGFDVAAGLQSLTPIVGDDHPATEAVDGDGVFTTEVDDRPEGLDSALAQMAVGGVDTIADTAPSTPSESDESVFSNPGGEAIRPSLATETAAPLPNDAPAGLIVDPGLLDGVSANFGETGFGDLDNEATDALDPGSFGTPDAPASLDQINASQEGAALDDGNAAALFAGANFDDLEAAFDEAADSPTHEESENERAENALRQSSDADVLYVRPPEDDDDDHALNVPSAPAAPSAPSLTLKKAPQLPHLSLSQATIEATALPLHGGSFVAEVSGPQPPGPRHNPALDEPTLVTRDRDVDRASRRPKKPALAVPTLWQGITPVRVIAVLFFACVLGTVFGALVAPGKTDRPITNRVRAEDQFADGNRAYEAGKLDDALGYFRGAIARDNTFGLGHRAMGTVLAKQNRHEEAARAYRTYLELTPGAVDEMQVIDIIKRYDPKMLPKKSAPVVDKAKEKSANASNPDPGGASDASRAKKNEALASAKGGENP